MQMIKIEISRRFMRHVKDGSYDTSICFDSTGFPLDDYGKFFCKFKWKVYLLEWGGMEYFYKINPFKPFKFSFESDTIFSFRIFRARYRKGYSFKCYFALIVIKL